MQNHLAAAALLEQQRSRLAADAEQRRLAQHARRHVADAERLASRVLEPSDIGAIAELFGRLSARSLYLRFGSPLVKMPASTLRHLAAVDHRRHEALGVFDDRTLVGSAHYFRSREEPAEAEISVEVADSHHRRGVATRLLRELAGLAVPQGISTFTATILSENWPVVSLLRHASWPTTSRVDGCELTVAMTLPSTLGGDG